MRLVSSNSIKAQNLRYFEERKRFDKLEEFRRSKVYDILNYETIILIEKKILDESDRWEIQR